MQRLFKILLSGYLLCLVDHGFGQTVTLKQQAFHGLRVEYPAEARQHRLTGSGVVLVHVDSKSGRVESAEMEKSTGHQILDDAATRAFSRSHIDPAGFSVARVPITFTLPPAGGGNLTTGSSNIDIGNAGVSAEARTTRIGATQSRAFVAGIRGAVVGGGVAVYMSATGQLGTNPSSKRFKQDIAPMDKKSEAILALRPVTFRYKEELDPSKVAQFGLIAEEVAKVNPNLVARDDKGEIYSVRYEAVNAMLLNEFLKEHSKVDQQQKEIIGLTEELKAQAAKHQNEIAGLTAALKEQADQIQKVSAQIALQRPERQTVAVSP